MRLNRVPPIVNERVARVECSVGPAAGTTGGESRSKNMQKKKSRGDQKSRKRRRPSGDAADKALQDVIAQERERGDVNIGAEPDQKGEIQKPQPRETD